MGSNLSFTKQLFICIVVAAVTTIQILGYAAGEPDFNREFDFGRMGINGYICDASTGRELPKDEVEFWAYPNTADSPEEVERVKVEAPGYVPTYVTDFSRRLIDLGFLQLVVLDLGRVELAKSTTERLPRITVHSDPSGGSLFVDGIYQGKTPIRRLEVKTGSHKLRVKKEGYDPCTMEVYLRSGETKTISEGDARLEKTNKPPVADFSFSPFDPSTEDEVHFVSNSHDSDGTITDYRWDFEGEGSDWGKRVNVQFSHEGEFAVTLEVTDDEGDTDSVTKRVEVHKVNRPPKSDFTYTPSEVAPSEVVSFTSQASDTDGYISDWKWEFGDGSSSSRRRPDHQYKESGTYEVRLTVRDQDGAEDVATKEVVVRSTKPKAEFTVSPENPTVRERVTLDASGSSDPDGSIGSFNWDIDGDGSTDRSGETISCEFTSPGTSEVTLTVTDESGNSTTASRKVSVSERPAVNVDDKHGLVIGIADYKYDSIDKLEYSDEDARDFYGFLTDDNYGAMDEENVTLLINEEATTQRIREGLRKLTAQADSDDLVIIFFSGHGMTGPDLDGDEEFDNYDEFFVTYDTNNRSNATLLSTGLVDDEFGYLTKSINSRQVAIFIDSCYSGGASKSVKSVSVPGRKGSPKNSGVFADFSSEDKLLFAASEEGQESWESDELENGVFTYFLLKGLKGKADEDEDGVIVDYELFDYVSDKVPQYVEANFQSDQLPFKKGGIYAPLSEGEKQPAGKVLKILKENPEDLGKGDLVTVDLGSNDGVRKGDFFNFPASSKGVEVTGKGEKDLQVSRLLDEHLSLCRIVRPGLDVKEGSKIRKVD
ncbi:PKD domain-containing protein [Candidatus Bipolaricaulota bacterium]|nr:PKD domain-containing protein [Candidatus Bipolaricaulota bacterium]